MPARRASSGRRGGATKSAASASRIACSCLRSRPVELEATSAARRKRADVAQRDVQELVRLGARVQPVQRIVAVGAHDVPQQRNGRADVRAGPEARDEEPLVLRTSAPREGRRALVHLIEPRAIAIQAHPGFAAVGGPEPLARIVAAVRLEPQKPRGLEQPALAPGAGDLDRSGDAIVEFEDVLALKGLSKRSTEATSTTAMTIHGER